MAIVSLPSPVLWSSRGWPNDSTNIILNAAGQTIYAVGNLYFPAQTGSKTISSAGGRIFWNTSASVVFADAGSTLSVGIQDVNASGINDGSFDVQGDLVGGTDTIGSTLCIDTAMESGTKTIGFLDLVAIGMTLVSRGGADSVPVNRAAGSTQPFGRTYGITNGVRSANVPQFLIKFDDGTYGWLLNAQLMYNVALGESLISFGSGATPDEYCAVIELATPMQICAFGFPLDSIATGDTFEMLVYSDPLGSPSVVSTFTPDPDQMLTAGIIFAPLTTPLDLDANTPYGFAVRPTTAGALNWQYFNAGSGFEVLKIAQPFSVIKMAARTDQTGAFVETQAYHTPDLFLLQSGMDDGSGGGGDVVGARIFTGY